MEDWVVQDAVKTAPQAWHNDIITWLLIGSDGHLVAMW